MNTVSRGDIELFAEFVMLAEQRQQYRAIPTTEFDTAVAKGEATLLRLQSAGRTPVRELVHMMRMLYVLKSLGEEGAPDLLIETVKRWGGPGGIRCRRGVDCDWR